jgi:class 3 adenylate cyclase
MEEIVAGRLSQELGGTQKEVCVLFSDIRNFTTYSEGKSPEEVISLLNEYFSEMTAAIHKHGGTVDKFIGDGIMAFFGAPKRLDCAERNALESAQDMLISLHHLNKKLAARGVQPIRIGIGLNSGKVVVGHVGSESRHEYTAIGDVVNTASRIEGLTKDLGYPIVCSSTVASAVGFAGGMVDLGEKPIKGHTDIHVYGWKPPVLEHLS